jgi:hypothetical protein
MLPRIQQDFHLNQRELGLQIFDAPMLLRKISTPQLDVKKFK